MHAYCIFSFFCCQKKRLISLFLSLSLRSSPFASAFPFFSFRFSFIRFSVVTVAVYAVFSFQRTDLVECLIKNFNSVLVRIFRCCCCYCWKVDTPANKGEWINILHVLLFIREVSRSFKWKCHTDKRHCNHQFNGTGWNLYLWPMKMYEFQPIQWHQMVQFVTRISSISFVCLHAKKNSKESNNIHKGREQTPKLVMLINFSFFALSFYLFLFSRKNFARKTNARTAVSQTQFSLCITAKAIANTDDYGRLSVLLHDYFVGIDHFWYILIANGCIYVAFRRPGVWPLMIFHDHTQTTPHFLNAVTIIVH